MARASPLFCVRRASKVQSRSTALAVAHRSATSCREGPFGSWCARDGVEGRLGLRLRSCS
eukprot:7173562-Alexandrium_andersonii.AAC.1